MRANRKLRTVTNRKLRKNRKLRAIRKLRKKSQSQRNRRHFLRESAIAAQSQMILRLAIAAQTQSVFTKNLHP
jgi:hypothetical protein